MDTYTYTSVCGLSSMILGIHSTKVSSNYYILLSYSSSELGFHGCLRRYQKRTHWVMIYITFCKIAPIILLYYTLFFHSFDIIFKRLAYTLTAYCYWSKSVTQPDASSKRYLLDNISCKQIVHKTTRTDINSRSLQAAVIV